MIEAETPSLWDIRRQLGHPAAVAILVNAFIHAAKLVNLDKNLTVEQIGEAANDILEARGYLKVEEVKYLLKRALRTQNVYGRLDYNVLMNWVEQYDAERTEEAMRISEQTSAQMQNAAPAPNAVSFDAYLAGLRERAKSDHNAALLLESVADQLPYGKTPLSEEDKQKKEHEFKMWRLTKYLRGNRE